MLAQGTAARELTDGRRDLPLTLRRLGRDPRAETQRTGRVRVRGSE